ncbi:MAG: VWA domain-containing protein [Acidobacteria bacterium]|nr:VWA domain-containing protein [Acidobacteriota bacterium]MBV9474838.1 VWA domain-containing protein [Acidobacteriota bacterium]
MSFRDVLLLWLLALVPFALLFLVTRERTRIRLARRFASERLRGVTMPARALRPWLLGVALAASVVALAGPYAGYTLMPVVAREANRVILIDVSNSMAAEDVGASRLDAAKAIAKRLIDAQEGRIGLVVFESEPEVVSPLTSDGDAVLALVDTLQAGEVGEPGSDLGSAILGSLRLIDSDPSQKADLVLISDGEEQGARVAEAVQRAKTRGVPVSTILLGSANGATIPTGHGPLRDATGDVVTTYARGDVLRDIANGTGGTMLENPFAAHALDPLLGSARVAKARETVARVPVDRYQWALGFAFVAFFLGSLAHRGAE